MANFNKLVDFLNDTSFNDYAQADKIGLDSRFNEYTNLGNQYYSIKSELNKIQGVVAREMGFDDVTITSDKGVANIVFHHSGDPDGTKNGSFSLSLGKSKDGMVYLNGMPQTNMGMYTQIGRGKKSAVVSSTTLALSAVADALRSYAPGWAKKGLTGTEVAKKAQSTISNAIKDKFKNNVALNNASQSAIAEIFDAKKWKDLTPESKKMYQQRLIMGDFINSFYNDVVKKAPSYSKRGVKPRSEREYRAEMEKIMSAAISGVKGKDLEKLVKQNSAWMYDNTWHQGLSEMVDFLSKANLVQGGIGFGVYDVVGTTKRSLPMINAVPSDKISKAARYLKETQRAIKRSKTRIGNTTLWTEDAHDAWSEEYGKDFTRNTLYGSSEISEDVIVEVRKELLKEIKAINKQLQNPNGDTVKLTNERAKLEKQLKQTMIGLGKDGSLMTEAMAQDFQGIKETHEYFTDGDILELGTLHDIIKKKLTKKLAKKDQNWGTLSDKEKEAAVDTELERVIKTHTDSAFTEKDEYNKYIRKVLQDYLGLDSNEHIDSKSRGYTLTAQGITNVNTYQKRAWTQITTRANTSDFRSVLSAISQDLMVRYLVKLGFTPNEIFQDVQNSEKGLKINLLAQKEGIEGKNIRDRTYGTLEYALNYAKDNYGKGQNQDQIDEIEAALKANGWGGIIKYDKRRKDFIINNDAFDRKYLRSPKGKDFGLADSLINASKFAQNVGAYRTGIDYYQKIQGKLVQLAPAMIAQEVHMAASSDYEGMGDETQSKFTVTNQTVQTARGNIGDMYRLYDDAGNRMFSDEQIKEMEDYANKQERLLAEGQKKLETHRQTLRVANEGWRDQGKGLDGQLGVAVYAAKELAELFGDTELNYDNSNEASGLIRPKNGFTVEEVLNSARESYFEKNKDALRAKFKGQFDALRAKFPKQSDEAIQKRVDAAIKKQIEVVADLGENYLYDKEHNRLTSKVTFYHGKQIKSADPNKYSLDEAGTANMRLANIVSQAIAPVDAGRDKGEIAQTLGRRYSGIQSEIADSIRHGGIYDSLTKVSAGSDSGWLKLAALAEGSEGVFKKILSNHGIYQPTDDRIPSMIMNVQDARAALEKLYNTKKGKKDIKNLRAELEKTRAATHKIGGKDAKDAKDIAYILDRFTLESDNYIGGGLFSQYLRHPVIKGYSDIMGGSVALTKDKLLASQGILRISRSQADIQKGDMDGDKVAMQIALANKDMGAFNSAFASYMKHYNKAHKRYLNAKDSKDKTEAQEWLDKINAARRARNEPEITDIKNLGDLSSINSPANKKTNSILGIAQNMGQKGAGIYGDEVKAALNIAESFGVGGEAIGSNSKEAVLANLATNIFHTLYQEGINIKNVKVDGLDAVNVQQFASAVLELSGKASTWKSFEQMENFLSLATKLGAGKATNFFSTKQLEDMHLADLTALGTAGEDVRDTFLNILQRTLKSVTKAYGKRNKKVTALKKDIKQLEDIKEKGERGIKGLSTTSIAALVTSDEFQTMFKDKEGRSFGDYIQGRYSQIGLLRPDRVYNERIGMLDRSFLETEEYKNLPEMIRKAIKAQIEDARNFPQDINPLYQKGKLDINGMVLSPTRNTKDVLPHAFGQVGRDLLSVLLPDGEYDPQAFEKLTENSVSGRIDWTSLQPILKGNIAHKSAEVIANIEKSGEFFTQDEITAKIHDTIYREVIPCELLIALTSGAFEDATGKQIDNNYITEFVNKQIARGKGNYRFLQNTGGTDEEMVGAELAIPMLYRSGQNDVVRGRGVIDYLSKTADSIKVYDYKNYASGTPSAENIIQILDYVNTLKNTRDRLKENSSIDFISFLGTEDDGDLLAQSWRERIYDIALDKLRGTKSKAEWEEDPFHKQLYSSNGKRNNDFEKILQATPEYLQAKNEQEELFKLLKTESAENIEGYIVSTNDIGVTSKYKVNTTSQAGKKLYHDYLEAVSNKGTLENDPTKMQAMEEFLKTNPSLVTQVGPSIFTGDKEDLLKLKQPEMQKYIELGQRRSELDFKLEKLAAMKELNETEVPEKRKSEEFFSEQEDAIIKQIDDLNKLIEEAKTSLEAQLKVTDDGKKYSILDENGESQEFAKSALDSFKNWSTEETLNARKAQLANQENLTYKRQYKEQYKGGVTARQQLADLKAQQQLSQEGTLELSETEQEALNEQVNQLEGFIKANNEIKKKLVEKIKSLPGGEELLQKYKDKSDEYWKKQGDEAYIKHSIQIRNENEKMFSTGQSSQQRVLNLQRQIEEYDKSLGNKKTSDAEKAIIEKLKNKAAQELERAQGDLDLYDKLYGKDGVKESADYLQGKGTAIDYAEIAKAQYELQEKETKQLNWEKDTGFMGMDAPTMKWFQSMLTGGGVYTLLAKFKKGLNDIIQKAIQLDKAMTNLRIVTGDSAEETRTLISNYSSLAKKLGVTTVEVAEGASEWLRQGYEVAEVNDLVTASMYLSKLGMIDSATATKDLTSALKGFKLEASDAMDIVDKLTALDVEAATTAGDIAEGLAQFANLATLNGVDIDQASAYVATIADITQQSGNSVGNAMKTIMSRYGNVKASAYDTINLNNSTDTSGDDLNDVEKILTKLGISMRDTNLEFKDFDEILDEIAGKWTTLDTVSKRAIANAFAGTRQQEAFLSLLENYDTYQDFVKVSQDSSGTAETKYQSYKESYEATKNSLTAAIEDLANNSTIIKTLEDLTKIGQKFVEWADKLAKYLPTLITQINSIRGLWGRGIVQRGAEMVSRAWKGKNPDTGIKAGLKKTGVWDAASNSRLGSKIKEKKYKKEIEKYNAELEKREDPLTPEEKKKYEDNKKWLEEHTKACKKSAKTIEKVNTTQEKEIKAKEETIKTAEEENKAKEEVVKSDKKETDANNQATQSEQNEKAANDLSTESELREAAANNQAAGSGSTSTGGGLLSSLKSGGGMMALNMMVSGLTNALTSLSTAATTHTVTYTNSKTGKTGTKEVESSEQAQKTGAAYTAAGNVLSGIPFIGAAISWGANVLGELIAGKIDELRDSANLLADEASEKLSALEGIESDLDTIGEDVSSIASQEAVSELMNTLYSEDGASARIELAKYLGGESALYNTLLEIKDGNEESYKKLQAAQLEAKKSQVADQYASQMYKNNEAVNDAYNDYKDYNGVTAGSAWTGIGAAFGTSAAIQLGTLGLALAIPAVGPIIAALGTIASIGFGVVAGVETSKAIEEENKRINAEQSEFLSKTTSEQMDYLNDEITKTREEMADGTITTEYGQESINKMNTLISALETQNALISKIQDEINDITLEQALLYASIGEGSDKKYIADMTTAELKNLGVDDILLAFAKGLEEAGGLFGENVWGDEGKTTLSDAGYEYLKTKLYNLGDEEINSVLSGGSRTLNEVLSMKDGKERDGLLKNFATALGVPTESLESLKELFGAITYSEAIMSTTDLTTRIEGYDSLISSITSGAGDVSSWMQTIISDYPELIAYMGDTPTLFKKITEKLKGLNEVYLNSAFSEVLQNQSLFTTTKETFYEILNDAAVQSALDAYGTTGATSYDNVWSYIQTQIQDDGTLTEEGQKAYDALQATFEKLNISVTSDKLSSQFKSAISYQSSLLDDQINNLTEQKEALQNINSQREYENKLIEAKLKLENASKEKKRVYRAGVGWVYEADQASIKEAQENLESVETEKDISSLETQITELQAQKEELNNIYTEINNARLKESFEALIEETKGESSSIDELIDWMKKGVAGTTKTGAEAAASKLATSKEDKEKAWKNMEDAWNALKDTNPEDTESYNTALQNYIDKAKIASSAGVTVEQMNTLGKLSGSDKTAYDVYNTGYATQSKNPKVSLSLTDTNGSYTGTVLFKDLASSAAMKDILSELQAGHGSVWDPSGTAIINDGKDKNYEYAMSGTETSLKDYITQLTSYGYDTNGITFSNGKTGNNNMAVYYRNGVFYQVQSTNIGSNTIYEGLAKAAVGSLGLQGGPTLINELGTEAIITPSGTITSLPSATGIVPADITRNLWELGEIAPSLLKSMQAIVPADTVGDSLLSSLMRDESTNINTINMNVNADSTFDANKFISSVKSRVALTRNSNK